MIKRTTLTLLFISLCLTAYSQEMNYIKNIRQLLSLYNQDLNSYKNDNVILLGGISGERLGVNMQLLPTVVIKKYFSEKVKIYFPSIASFNLIARLQQENPETVSLDFYSTRNEGYYRNQQSPLILKKEYDELIEIFKNDEWKFTNADYASTGYLIFNKQDLQLTITFELVGDVQEDPLYSSVNYRRPANHVPTLSRYVHFVFRQNLRYTK